jgi:hypothetical protein
VGYRHAYLLHKCPEWNSQAWYNTRNTAGSSMSAWRETRLTKSTYRQSLGHSHLMSRY